MQDSEVTPELSPSAAPEAASFRMSFCFSRSCVGGFWTNGATPRPRDRFGSIPVAPPNELTNFGSSLRRLVEHIALRRMEHKRKDQQQVPKWHFPSDSLALPSFSYVGWLYACLAVEVC